MSIKEKVLEHVNIMKAITDCGFSGMARTDFGVMMHNVIEMRRSFYDHLKDVNLTDEDKGWLLVDWENFCVFIYKTTLKRGWCRVDTANLAESLITEYEFVKPYDDKGIAYNKTQKYILDVVKAVKGKGYKASIFVQIYRIYSDKFKDMDAQTQK